MARSGSRGRHSGGAVLRQLRARLGKGWPAGLTVLTGEDLFHLDAAFKVLLGHLVPETETDYALTVFAESRIDEVDVVAAARSMPMFTSRRVVAVRDASILEGDGRVLADYAGTPPPESHLLVRAPRLDLRRKLHKVLQGTGTHLEFSPVVLGEGGQELHREVREMAAERELRLDRDAVEYLLEACGGDLYRVRSELDKLEVWFVAGEDRRVDLRTAREAACGGGALSGWEAADAVFRRDLAAALAAVRRLVDSGEQPLRLLGGIAWRARGLLQARAMVAGRRSREHALRAARAWSYRGSFEAGMRRYDLSELSAFPVHLLRADRSLKSRSLEPGVVLEMLMHDLIGPRTAEPGRGSR